MTTLAKTSARAVIIGGGIAGCSALYHLTQEGWSDVVLLERDELTSGTTWHSAAQVTNLGAIQVMVGLKTHSIRLYQELANDPDYPEGMVSVWPQCQIESAQLQGLLGPSEQWDLPGFGSVPCFDVLVSDGFVCFSGAPPMFLVEHADGWGPVVRSDISEFEQVPQPCY